MDPNLVIATQAARILARLAAAGVAWTQSPDGLDEGDLQLVSAFADAADRGRHVVLPGRSSLASLHLELVTRAFGEAFRRHWGFNAELAPRKGLLQQVWPGERLAQVERATRSAALHLLETGGADTRAELTQVEALVAGPLSTPWYRALWQAFTEPDERAPTPLLMLEGVGRRLFERHVLLAWWELLAGPQGDPLRRWLADLEEHRARLVRDLCVADLAAAPTRGVLAGPDEEGLALGLALGALWVPPRLREYAPTEPADADDETDDGTEWVDEEPATTPGEEGAFESIERHLRRETVVIVTAPFGHGKSLLARMLAAHWAEAWLSEPEPSPDLVLPVLVRCAEDFRAAGEGRRFGFDLENTVRRAWQRQAKHAGLHVRIGDPALAVPDDAQRVVFLLDGLDEMGLGPKELDDLLADLRGYGSDRHRFVLFTRPGVLPAVGRLGGVRLLQLLDFDAEQIGAWLERWSVARGGAPIRLEALEARGLSTLAATPILLLLIASGWEEADGGSARGVRLYEAFFRSIAQGKLAFDREHHPVIAAASERLLDALRARGEITGREGPVEAMLWLLGRVAWEGAALAATGRVLQGRDVDRIVADELHIGDGTADVARMVRVGVLLAIQADVGGELDRILFGHTSFADFLVSRYAASRLARISRGRERDWPAREAELGGVRFCAREESWRFLAETLEEFPASDRRRLGTWAEEVVNDDRVDVDRSQSFRLDRRAPLREAALAVAAATHHAITLRDPGGLRTLFGWAFSVGERLKIVAPGLVAPGLDLHGADLSGADFSGASLPGSVWSSARLEKSRFSRSDLTGAGFDRACLRDASLEGARACGADLFLADARESRWMGADLRNAVLYKARLDGADLTAAVMREIDGSEVELAQAVLTNADLRGAILEEAILAGADLSDASLRGANLCGIKAKNADFTGADLGDCDLSGADLRGARLARAVLRGANLADADLRGADLTDVDLTDAELEGCRR